ncbi:MAG: AAA family ATPase [Deltaproteobacteria bacterium]|nr:AAA family ATPase [Deltaproteobacteria bacterium]
MYLNHYDLKEKPFQISTDPKFIWLGESHKEALAVLEHGVLSNMGFLLVTGDVGTGKTTLVNTLLKRLGNETIVANITNPVLEQLDFFNLIADELNINKKFHSKEAFLFHFNQFLNDCYLQKKKVILIIDEAHRLDQELLEQIQLLSTVKNQDITLLSTFFIGQDEFNDIIAQKRNQALHQKISVKFHLEPLKESEIKEYISYRLRIAGHKENLFNASAIREIFSFSKGYPRLINIICDHALLTGYVIDTKIIDAKIIKECAAGLFMPTQGIDNSKKQPATVTQITNQKEPSIKSSGKHVKAFVVTGLSLIVLGILFYSGMDGKYFAKLTQYFKQDANHPTKLTSISVPQPDNPDKKRNLSAEKPQNIDKRTIAVTDPVSNTADSSAQEEDSIPPKKSYKIVDPDASDAPNQKDRLNRIDELRKVWEVPSIPPPKTVINFGHNSNDLSDEDFETIEPIGAFISQHPDAKIIIKGYTDALGKYLYNKRISEFRANLVKSYFVGRGISPSRIQVFGMGSENPRRSNQTREGRMLNRRVEINITFD